MELFVRMAAQKTSSSGRVKFVLLLPGSVAAAKPKPPLATAPAIGPKTKSPDHLFIGVHKAVAAMWLNKATMSTGNDNITGTHVIQRPQGRGAKYFSITLSFPATLIHMHSFISSAIDTHSAFEDGLTCKVGRLRRGSSC